MIWTIIKQLDHTDHADILYIGEYAKIRKIWDEEIYPMREINWLNPNTDTFIITKDNTRYWFKPMM